MARVWRRSVLCKYPLFCVCVFLLIPLTNEKFSWLQDVCALDRAGSDRPADIDRPQGAEKMSTSKISSEEFTTEIINVSEYTREELKAMADARIGISS